MATKQVQLKKQAYASNLKSRALSVLIYLIDRSNQELTCFPAISTMAEQLHISVSTVKRALRELVDGGHISKEARFREKNRGQSSNLYTLVLQQGGDGVKNNDSPDVRENLESATDRFSCIEEEQKQKFSDGMPQGRGARHIGFESLKNEEEGEKEKIKIKRKVTLRNCWVKEKGTMSMKCSLKEFNIMSKQKEIFWLYRRLIDCIPDHFRIGSFNARFRGIRIFRGRQVNGEIALVNKNWTQILNFFTTKIVFYAMP